MKERKSTISRVTKETSIELSLNLDGTGKCECSTGIGFLDHMFTLLARHSLIDVTIKATGDTEVDYHHSVEDIGLAFGTALDKALNDRAGIRRYGFFLMPMDDSLCELALDLGGRPFLSYSTIVENSFVRDFDTRIFEDFFRSVSVNGRLNLHVKQTGSDEAHHAIESIFKAFARALRSAVEIDPRESGIPSSKGLL